MPAVIGHERNIEQPHDRRDPGVSGVDRIAEFVRVASDFRPDFAEFFVGVNDAETGRKFFKFCIFLLPQLLCSFQR